MAAWDFETQRIQYVYCLHAMRRRLTCIALFTCSPPFLFSLRSSERLQQRAERSSVLAKSGTTAQCHRK